MRTFISVLVVLILCVVAVGFYRGWFMLSGPTRDSDGNKVNIELSVDPDKVKADAAQAKGKVAELSGKNKEEGK